MSTFNDQIQESELAEKTMSRKKSRRLLREVVLLEERNGPLLNAAVNAVKMD